MTRSLAQCCIGLIVLLCIIGCGGGGGGTLPAFVLSALAPTGAIGAPGTTAQFSVGASGPVAGYAWNFGGGANPNASNAATPIVTLGAAGSYTGTITATSTDGQTTSQNFNLTIAPIAPPPALNTYPLEAVGPIAIEPFMVLLNDRLWMTYSDATSRKMRVAEALVAEPTSALDWRMHTIETSSPIRFSTTLAIFNGRLAAVQISDTGEVQYFRALVAAPTSTSDWEVLTLANAGGEAADVFIIPHLQAFVVGWWGGDSSGPTPVHLAHALRSEPHGLADWHQFILDPLAGHTPVDLGVLGERLVVTYPALDGANKVAISKTTQTMSAADFDFHFADPDPNPDGPDAHMAIVQDRLLLLYHQDGGLLSLARARVPLPTGPGDYQIHILDTGARPTARNAIAVVDGRLAFSYINTDNRNLKVARALSMSPTQASDWELRTVDPGNETGRYSGITWTPGGIGVVYADEPNEQLKFALATSRW